MAGGGDEVIDIEADSLLGGGSVVSGNLDFCSLLIYFLPTCSCIVLLGVENMKSLAFDNCIGGGLSEIDIAFLASHSLLFAALIDRLGG